MNDGQAKCFACGKTIRSEPHWVDTRDDQIVAVGPDCYKKIMEAGEAGYRPPGWQEGYVRLYPLKGQG